MQSAFKSPIIIPYDVWNWLAAALKTGRSALISATASVGLVCETVMKNCGRSVSVCVCVCVCVVGMCGWVDECIHYY